MRPEELLAHNDFLKALALSLVRDQHQAADMTQETWLAALKHPPSPEKPLKAWLALVLRNFVRMAQRVEARRKAREAAVAQAEGIPSAEEIAAQEEIRRQVVDKVLTLEEPYRSAIVLRYYQNLSHREVAKRMNVPLETMRSRLKKGLALLRGALDGANEGDRKKWVLSLAPLAGLQLTRSAAPAATGAAAGMAGGFALSTKVIMGISAALILIAVTYTIISILPEASEYESPKLIAADDLSREAIKEDAPNPLLAETSRPEKLALAPSKDTNTISSFLEGSAVHITGSFLDLEGRPISGVAVWEENNRKPTPEILEKMAEEIDPDSEAFKIAINEKPFALSGPDGKFTISFGDMNPGIGPIPFKLLATKEGYSPFRSEINMVTGKPHSMGELVLARSGGLSGRVVDPQGMPIPFATVEITKARLDWGSSTLLKRKGPRISSNKCTADGGGAFLLTDLPEGLIRVWAKAEGSLYNFTKPLEVLPGRVSPDVVVVLEPILDEDLIEGVVLSPEGEPNPRARVTALYEEFFGKSFLSEDTDDMGRFRFLLRNKTAHHIKVRDLEDRYTRAAIEEVEPGTRNLVIRLLPKVVFPLSIHVEQGKAPDRFEVHLFYSDDYDNYSKRKNSRSDLDVHQFEWVESSVEKGVEVPVPNEKFFMVVKAPGFYDVELGPLYPEPHADPMKVLLTKVRGVRGLVLADGKPLAGAKVTLHDGGMDCYYKTSGCLCRSLPESEARTKSGKDGEFMLSLQRSGIFYLRVENKGYAPAELGPIELNHLTGSEALEVILTKGGSLEGRLIPLANQESEGQVICINRGDGFPLTQRTGPDGIYKFDLLTPGPWLVEYRSRNINPRITISSCTDKRIDSPLEIPWVCMVEEGKNTLYDLNLFAKSRSILSGRFTFQGDAPSGWKALLGPQETDTADVLSSREVSLDARGIFTFHTNAPGEYTLYLEGFTGQGTRLLVIVFLTLELGENPWSLDLSLGKVKIKGLPRTEEEDVTYNYQWEGPDHQYSITEIKLSSSGESEVLTVPIGNGAVIKSRLIQTSENGYSEDEEVLKVVEVLPGQTIVVEL